VDKVEAARRLIEGFSSAFRGFIVDPSLDDPSIFKDVLRGCGVGSLVSFSRIGNSDLQLIRVNGRPCEAKCRYEECPEGGAKCIDGCVSRCVEERARQIVLKLKATYLGSQA